MKHTHSIGGILFTISLCLAAFPGLAAAREDEALQRRCATTRVDDHIELRIVKGTLVSACPPDAEEGCPYSASRGQTHLASTPDLNQDGRVDAIVRYPGSSYGDVDAVGYLVLAQCQDGTYVRVLEGTFNDLRAPTSVQQNWPDLTATQACPTPDNTDPAPVESLLRFDIGAFQYLPASDDSLSSPCG